MHNLNIPKKGDRIRCLTNVDIYGNVHRSLVKGEVYVVKYIKYNEWSELFCYGITINNNLESIPMNMFINIDCNRNEVIDTILSDECGNNNDYTTGDIISIINILRGDPRLLHGDIVKLLKDYDDGVYTNV